MCMQNAMRTDAQRRVCAAMVPYRWATRETSLRELEHTHTHTHTHTPVLTGLKRDPHWSYQYCLWSNLFTLRRFGRSLNWRDNFSETYFELCLTRSESGLLFRCFKFSYIFIALFDIQNTCNQWNISVCFAIFCNGSNFCDVLCASLDDELSASKIGIPYIWEKEWTPQWSKFFPIRDQSP